MLIPSLATRTNFYFLIMRNIICTMSIIAVKQFYNYHVAIDLMNTNQD